MGTLRYARQRLGMGLGLLDTPSRRDPGQRLRALAPQELRNRRHPRRQFCGRISPGAIGHSVAAADRKAYLQYRLSRGAHARRLTIADEPEAQWRSRPLRPSTSALLRHDEFILTKCFAV